jgi:hypothetical protein
MATRTLTEKIEALPAEKKAEVEDFVEFLASRRLDNGTAPRQPTPAPQDDLLERIAEHREQLRQKYGLFDSVPIIRELREHGPR